MCKSSATRSRIRSSSPPTSPPPGRDFTDRLNLLNNADFSAELSDWEAFHPDQCRMAIVPSPDTPTQHVVSITERAAGNTGLQQDITEILKAHGPGNYTYTARVRAVTGEVSVKVKLWLEDETGVQQHPAPDVTASDQTWHITERTQRLQWSSLRRAHLIVESGYSDSSDFLVGGCGLYR